MSCFQLTQSIAMRTFRQERQQVLLSLRKAQVWQGRSSKPACHNGKYYLRPSLWIPSLVLSENLLSAISWALSFLPYKNLPFGHLLPRPP